MNDKQRAVQHRLNDKLRAIQQPMNDKMTAIQTHLSMLYKYGTEIFYDPLTVTGTSNVIAAGAFLTHRARVKINLLVKCKVKIQWAMI